MYAQRIKTYPFIFSYIMQEYIYIDKYKNIRAMYENRYKNIQSPFDVNLTIGRLLLLPRTYVDLSRLFLSLGDTFLK